MKASNGARVPFLQHPGSGTCICYVIENGRVMVGGTLGTSCPPRVKAPKLRRSRGESRADVPDLGFHPVAVLLFGTRNRAEFSVNPSDDCKVHHSNNLPLPSMPLPLGIRRAIFECGRISITNPQYCRRGGRGLLVGLRRSYPPASEREARMDDPTPRREPGNGMRPSRLLSQAGASIFSRLPRNDL